VKSKMMTGCLVTRRLQVLASRSRPLARCFSTTEVSNQRLVIQRQEPGVASLQLSSGPANLLSAGMCEDLINAMRELDEVRALRTAERARGPPLARLRSDSSTLPPTHFVSGPHCAWRRDWLISAWDLLGGT
jgi:hypothetical protein